MGLTKRSENSMVYLEVKHYCLWRALKKQVPGCDEVDANNPTTGATVKKYGYRFDTVTGQVVKLLKYDTERKYSKRFFGFKLHLVDGADTFVLDMPYTSQILRRFLRAARNINWLQPLSITIFKGKKKENGGFEETGIWFHQLGQTIKPYYTKEQPHGMPEATYDGVELSWDFKAQHRWLVERLQTETIPDIAEASEHFAPPDEPAREEHTDSSEEDGVEIPPHNDYLDDDDVPF